MSFKKQSGRVLALVVACLAAVSIVAIAQVQNSTKGVAPSRIVIGVFSAQAPESAAIADGTLLMIDTTTAASGTLVGVKPYDPAALQNRGRVIGLAYGAIPKRGNGPGQCLIYGVHNNALVASSTLALNIPVRAGAVYGRLSTAVDSTSMTVGWAISKYGTSNTASNARARVWFNGPGRNIGAL